MIYAEAPVQRENIALKVPAQGEVVMRREILCKVHKH